VRRAAGSASAPLGSPKSTPALARSAEAADPPAIDSCRRFAGAGLVVCPRYRFTSHPCASRHQPCHRGTKLLRRRTGPAKVIASCHLARDGTGPCLRNPGRQVDQTGNDAQLAGRICPDDADPRKREGCLS
jgi:hypothetical protein